MPKVVVVKLDTIEDCDRELGELLKALGAVSVLSKTEVMGRIDLILEVRYTLLHGPLEAVAGAVVELPASGS